ncbi:protein of unknown function [Petrocella atlantisensis]|uniref:Uncharacterized protein n=1 Tax=Petrocella atlantisensis TaxID=2173034 RepID=A0A3P7Q0E8_9FIRM|nr:protein of unknown function [Petrocella atlantisensis]
MGLRKGKENILKTYDHEGILSINHNSEKSPFLSVYTIRFGHGSFGSIILL